MCLRQRVTAASFRPASTLLWSEVMPPVHDRPRIRIATVLCPVDRSDVSRRALEYGVALAAALRARLNVLEVVEWVWPPAGAVSTIADLPPEVQAATLDALNAFVAPARRAGVPTEIAIEAGSVTREILARADAIGADLIVMGTHGRAGLERLALGSVAEKIVRQAKCPVLTVPRGVAIVERKTAS
jgi:nucleotide-binding universal stress UspA family protein